MSFESKHGTAELTLIQIVHFAEDLETHGVGYSGLTIDLTNCQTDGVGSPTTPAKGRSPHAIDYADSPGSVQTSGPVCDIRETLSGRLRSVY
jgi:hypothetical protein